MEDHDQNPVCFSLELAPPATTAAPTAAPTAAEAAAAMPPVHLWIAAATHAAAHTARSPVGVGLGIASTGNVAHGRGSLGPRGGTCAGLGLSRWPICFAAATRWPIRFAATGRSVGSLIASATSLIGLLPGALSAITCCPVALVVFEAFKCALADIFGLAVSLRRQSR